MKSIYKIVATRPNRIGGNMMTHFVKALTISSALEKVEGKIEPELSSINVTLVVECKDIIE